MSHGWEKLGANFEHFFWLVGLAFNLLINARTLTLKMETQKIFHHAKKDNLSNIL